jgi:hypothetical protein
MARDIHHIFPNGHGGWCVRRDGDTRALANTDTKIKAIKIGIELSDQRDALVVIHAQERRSSRLGSTPAEIPFPFPFSDRETAQAGAETPPGAGKRRKAAGATAAETYLTFDFDNGARP